MKSSHGTSFPSRSTGIFMALALLSPILFAEEPPTSSSEPATPSEQTAGQAASKLDDYRTEATDTNKAEAKAALKRLDADIDLLEAKIDAVPDPMRKKELTMRLKLLKERRKELGREFRKASYDALVADVRAEWNQLTN